MRPLAILLLAACASRPPVTHIPALGAPAEGVAPYVWIDRWVESAILCVVDHGIKEPIIDRGAWACPLSAGVQQ